jgi:hypothetical protein
MRDDILVCFILKHLLVKKNVMVVLVVFFVLEVIDDCQLGRIVFKQYLHWH